MRFVFNHRQLCKWNFIIELTVFDHDNINERTCFQVKIRKSFVYQKIFSFNLKKKIHKMMFQKFLFKIHLNIKSNCNKKKLCIIYACFTLHIVARFTIHMQGFYIIDKHRSTITSQSAPFIASRKIFRHHYVSLFFSLLVTVCFKFFHLIFIVS